MATVDDSHGRPQDEDAGHRDGEDDSLLSQRSLLIFLVAAGVGLLSGLGSAFMAGFAAAGAGGPTVGIMVGITTGLSTATLVSLAVAKALHALVSKKSS